MTMDFILLDGLGGKGFLQRGNRTGTAFDEEVWAGLKDRQQGRGERERDILTGFPCLLTRRHQDEMGKI